MASAFAQRKTWRAVTEFRWVELSEIGEEEHRHRDRVMVRDMKNTQNTKTQNRQRTVELRTAEEPKNRTPSQITTHHHKSPPTKIRNIEFLFLETPVN